MYYLGFVTKGTCSIQKNIQLPTQGNTSYKRSGTYGLVYLISSYKNHGNRKVIKKNNVFHITILI